MTLWYLENMALLAEKKFTNLALNKKPVPSQKIRGASGWHKNSFLANSHGRDFYTLDSKRHNQ